MNTNTWKHACYCAFMYTFTEKHVCFHVISLVIVLTFDPTGKGSIPIPLLAMLVAGCACTSCFLDHNIIHIMLISMTKLTVAFSQLKWVFVHDKISFTWEYP